MEEAKFEQKQMERGREGGWEWGEDRETRQKGERVNPVGEGG